MEVADEIQKDLAKLLTDSLPKELKAVGRTTGGMDHKLNPSAWTTFLLN